MFLINHHSISHNGIGTNRIASLLYRIPGVSFYGIDGCSVTAFHDSPCASVLFWRGIVCRTFWKWAACDHCEKPVGERRRPEVLVVVGIHRATRMVCLFRVLVCRPGRTHSKRCGAKIFCLYGREELVSKPRKMAGGR